MPRRCYDIDEVRISEAVATQEATELKQLRITLDELIGETLEIKAAKGLLRDLENSDNDHIDVARRKQELLSARLRRLQEKKVNIFEDAQILIYSTLDTAINYERLVQLQEKIYTLIGEYPNSDLLENDATNLIRFTAQTVEKIRQLKSYRA